MEILKKYRIWENVVRHCVHVRDIALFIAGKWPEKIDLKKLEAAALLHDIKKQTEVTAIKFGRPTKFHGELGSEEMKKLGFDELAPLVYKHTMQTLLEHPDFIKWEPEALILCYSDNLSQGGEVKSVESAFSRYRERYPYLIEALNKEEPIVKEMEKYILEKTRLTFENIQKKLNNK